MSVALAILGTARVVGVLRHNRASDAEIVRLFAWAIVPLSAAVAGMAAMLGESVAPGWWCVKTGIPGCPGNAHRIWVFC